MKQYQLEFSKTGAQFIDIATLNARPGTGTLSYNNLHRNYVNGTNYYRVKVIDMDGNVTYSSTVLINVHDFGSVVVYPNPTTDNLFINYRGDNSTINIEIVDAIGQVVYSNKTAVVNPIVIPVSKLSSGNYILRITDGANILNTKFVKD